MLASIAFLPGLADRWGWPKLLLLVIAVAFGTWATAAGRLSRGAVIAIGCGFTVLIGAALLGAAPLAQIMGRAPRYEGLVGLGVYAAAVWLGARLLGPAAPMTRVRSFFYALSVSSSTLAVIAIAESVGARPLESDLLRPGSLAGNATDQGILGVIFLAVLGSAVLGTYQRTSSVLWVPLAGAIAAIASVLTSASRAALLGLILVLAALAVRLVWRAKRRVHTAIMAGVGFAAILIAVLAIPLTRIRVLGTGALASQTIDDRFEIWGATLALIAHHPLLGVGPNGYSDAITPYLPDDWFQRAEVGSVLGSPHNVALQVATSAGVVGVALVAVVVVAVIWIGVRRTREATGARRDILTGGIIAVGATSLAWTTHMTAPATALPLALLIGAMISVSPRDRPAPWAAISARVAALALVLVLLLWSVGDAYLRAGATSARSGNIDDAHSAFQSAHALRPWDGDIPLRAAEALGGALDQGLAGAGDPALEWATMAAGRLPNSTRAAQAEGMIRMARGEYDKAIQSLARATELSPPDPRLWHELGVAYAASGNIEESVSALRRAVTLAPDSEESAELLSELTD